MNTTQKDTATTINVLTQARHAAWLQVCEEIKPALPRLMAAVESNAVPSDVPEWLLVGTCAAIRPDGSLCWDTLKGILAGKMLVVMEKAWTVQGGTLCATAQDNDIDLLTFTREAWAGLEHCAPAVAPREGL